MQKIHLAISILVFVTLGSNTASASEIPNLKDVPVLRFGEFTFQPGLRVQVRYVFDHATDANDILIRRTRLKAKGDMFDLGKYYFELKIDNVGQQASSSIARVEGAYLEFPFHPDLNLRIGQYDVPFSRNSLTSDSRLLFMDRSLVTARLAALGLADNTQGALLYGKPGNGRFEYKMGVFDNEVFEKSSVRPNAESKQLMFASRLALNFLDSTKDGGYGDYRSSYIGKGRRISLAGNFSRLGNVNEGSNKFNVASWGFDVFASYEPITFQAEVDWFQESADGYGWYAQSGYVVPYSIKGIQVEPGIRYQKLKHNGLLDIEESSWTSLGLNLYVKDHNLKIQAEYTFKQEAEHIVNDVFQAQLQVDF